MVAATTGTVAIGGVAGVVIILLLVAVWRVVIHDPTVRRVRFGVFYERERDKEERDE